RALHLEMLACHARRDLPAYYRANQSVHDLINRAARNDALREIYMSVNSRVNALQFEPGRRAVRCGGPRALDDDRCARGQAWRAHGIDPGRSSARETRCRFG